MNMTGCLFQSSFFSQLLLVALAPSVLAVEEVASLSNLFPSPTGIYQNRSADTVVYGATVHLSVKDCLPSDRSSKLPTGTTGAIMCVGLRHTSG